MILLEKYPWKRKHLKMRFFNSPKINIREKMVMCK